MGLGTDMKSLVEDIQLSRDSRMQWLDDVRKDAHHIIGDAKSMLKDFAKESEKRAAEVKRLGHEVRLFLKSSQEGREHDFEATMKTVNTSLEDVKKDSMHWRHAGKAIVKDAKALLANIAKDNKEQAKELRAGLKKSDQNRKADFKSMMENFQEDMEKIKEDLKHVRRDSAQARKDAKNMVSRYHHSRMSARKHWASLSAGGKKRKHKSEE